MTASCALSLKIEWTVSMMIRSGIRLGLLAMTLLTAILATTARAGIYNASVSAGVGST